MCVERLHFGTYLGMILGVSQGLLRVRVWLREPARVKPRKHWVPRSASKTSTEVHPETQLLQQTKSKYGKLTSTHERKIYGAMHTTSKSLKYSVRIYTHTHAHTHRRIHTQGYTQLNIYVARSNLEEYVTRFGSNFGVCLCGCRQCVQTCEECMCPWCVHVCEECMCAWCVHGVYLVQKKHVWTGKGR